MPHACLVLRGLAVALIALAAPALAAQRAPADPRAVEASGERAPDGSRGFGEQIELSRAIEIVRARDEADREFITQLRGLDGRLRVVLAGWREKERARGTFELAGLGADAGLEDLLARWNERREAAFEAARFDAFEARMFGALRLRIAGELLSASASDARDVRDGLALLLAHIEGWADLRQEEVGSIVGRIDLAASRMRARLADLEVLAATRSQDEFETRIEQAALDLSELPEATERRRALDKVLDRALESEESVRDLLALPRLERKLERVFWTRDQRVGMAAASVAALRETCTETEEGKSARKEIAAMSAQDRNGAVIFEGRTQLADDPLNAELVLVVALSVDFLQGNRESLKWFDRYLALRGIRSARDDTWRDRELTADERRALDEVQQAERGGPLQPR